MEVQSTETVRDVLEGRLKALLQERISILLVGSSAEKSNNAILSGLAGELADEAVSALGIRESDLQEPWCEDSDDEEEKE